jgi:hypothetical protein
MKGEIALADEPLIQKLKLLLSRVATGHHQCAVTIEAYRQDI